MLFNSLAFAIFLPVVFGLYWLVPNKYQWLVIMLSSCYFYMSWNVKYILIILFITAVSYICACLMEKFPEKKKKLLLVAGTASLGILFFFKYFDFTAESIAKILNLSADSFRPVSLGFLLPVGISFYTFQTIGYTIDVYRGTMEAEHHFGKYTAFITFFPQLVAGPIERAGNLLPQIREKHEFNYTQVVYGMKLMAWGFFKKLAAADTLAMFVDRIYGDVYLYKGLSLVVATVFFAFQIYCDFSGYSDIAAGTAKLFGIELMANFKSPYFSASIKEFWSRWHISLSTWFRDYVYIPLGGNRKGIYRKHLNQMVTFMVSGLWHGASGTFILWGGLHGGLQVIENILHRKPDSGRGHVWKRIVSMGVVFLFVCIGWVFFRSQTVEEAVYVFKNMFVGAGDIQEYMRKGYYDLALTRFRLIRIMASLIILAMFDYISLKKDVIELTGRLPVVLRWSIYYILIFYVIILGDFGSSQFVYFQF